MKIATPLATIKAPRLSTIGGETRKAAEAITAIASARPARRNVTMTGAVSMRFINDDTAAGPMAGMGGKLPLESHLHMLDQSSDRRRNPYQSPGTAYSEPATERQMRAPAALGSVLCPTTHLTTLPARARSGLR